MRDHYYVTIIRSLSTGTRASYLLFALPIVLHLRSPVLVLLLEEAAAIHSLILLLLMVILATTSR